MALFELEHFFVNDRPVARARTLVVLGDGRPAIWLRNKVYVCPVCGNTWGRRVFENPPLALWLVNPVPCPEHGGGYLLSGTSYAADLDAIAACGEQKRFLMMEVLYWHNRKTHDYLNRAPDSARVRAYCKEYF